MIFPHGATTGMRNWGEYEVNVMSKSTGNPTQTLTQKMPQYAQQALKLIGNVSTHLFLNGSKELLPA